MRDHLTLVVIIVSQCNCVYLLLRYVTMYDDE